MLLPLGINGLMIRKCDFWLVALMLSVLTLIVYWPGLAGGYTLDDFSNIVDNPAFAPGRLDSNFWSAVWSSGSGPTDRPLSMLTFAMQAYFTGLAPWPLKFVNVLIHIVNGVLVLILMRALLRYLHETSLQKHPVLIGPDLLAALIAAAWLFSPMQLTAVLYVVQRMESLSAMFVLAGLVLFWFGRLRLMRGRSGAWPLILGGLVGGTLFAALAKETGVMLPLYAFLLEWIVLRGRGAGGVFDSKLIWLFALLLLLPGLAGVIYTLPAVLNGTAYTGRPFDLAERLWTEGRVLIDYLQWILAPTLNKLSLYHDDIAISTGWFSPWTTATSWMLIALMFGAAWKLRARMPLVSLGVFWFFGGQALVSTYLPLELAYEHRNYLPSLGVYITIFSLIFTLRVDSQQRTEIIRTLALASVSALIVLFGFFTTLRAQIWSDPYRQAYFESTTHPGSPRASYELARIMMIIAPDVDSPLFHIGFKQMMAAARMPGSSLQPDQALIFIASKKHLHVSPMWWSALRDKIGRVPLSPEDISALYSLIGCGIDNVCDYTPSDVSQLGRTLAHAEKCQPKNPGILTLYANYAANISHDIPLAHQLMMRVVVLAPGNFNYWKNLIVLQIALGDLSAAKAGIERLHELNSFGRYDADIRSVQRSFRDKQSKQLTSVSS